MGSATMCNLHGRTTQRLLFFPGFIASAWAIHITLGTCLGVVMGVVCMDAL